MNNVDAGWLFVGVLWALVLAPLLLTALLDRKPRE